MDDVIRVNADGFGHALLRAVEPNGLEVREALPARRLSVDTVEILGSPGMLMGFAAGDTLRVNADKTFALIDRGPNACIQIFAKPPLTPELLDELRDGFAASGGLVEAPPHRNFAVVTVPAAVGTEELSRIMTEWAQGAERVEWFFAAPAE